MKACKDCDYAHPTTARQVIGESPDSFECRYNPPAVLPLQRINQMSQQVELGTMAAFPTVAGDLNCGRFRKRKG